MPAPRSVAILGAGQIGFAAAQTFTEGGWQVRVFARSRPAWLAQIASDFQKWKRGDPVPAAEVVLDTIAYDAADLADCRPDEIGRLIAVSSASVYRNAAGRTLDEAAVNGFPEFAGPVTEQQITVAPGPRTYSTRKVRMEQAALVRFKENAAILRPCAIHGSWSRHLREWWFVKRLLDGRRLIPLALEGQSRFQTTSAKVIADFALHAAEGEIGGVFNLADGHSPTVRQIGAAIMGVLGLDAQLVPFSGTPESNVGRTPWSVPKPFITSAAKAAGTGFPATLTYSDAVIPAAKWLQSHAPKDWQAAFPQLAIYPWNLFDYPAEDAMLEKL